MPEDWGKESQKRFVVVPLQSREWDLGLRRAILETYSPIQSLPVHSIQHHWQYALHAIVRERSVSQIVGYLATNGDRPAVLLAKVQGEDGAGLGWEREIESGMCDSPPPALRHPLAWTAPYPRTASSATYSWDMWWQLDICAVYRKLITRSVSVNPQ